VDPLTGEYVGPRTYWLPGGHRTRVTDVVCAERNVDAVLDAAKIADVIVYVTVAGEPFDELSREMVACVRAQGVSSVMGVMQGMQRVPEKLRAPERKGFRGLLEWELHREVRVMTWDPVASPHCDAKVNAAGVAEFARHMACDALREVAWRENHPYVVGEPSALSFTPDPADPSRGTLGVTGYLRGKAALSCARLVHVVNWGDFELARIDAARDPCPFTVHKHHGVKPIGSSAAADAKVGGDTGVPHPVILDARPGTADAARVTTIVTAGAATAAAAGSGMIDADGDADSMHGNGGAAGSAAGTAAAAGASVPGLPGSLGGGVEDLKTHNEPDMLANEQTWPTDDELRAADRERRRIRKRGGGNEFEAAWFEYEEEVRAATTAEDLAAADAAGLLPAAAASSMQIDHDGEMMGGGDSDASDDDGAGDSGGDESGDMDMDEIAKQRNFEMVQRSREDMEFQDEVDTPLDVAARTRYAKYRGLKSFRTSNWDPKENLPLDYARIFQFRHPKQMQKLVSQSLDRGVEPGQWVTLHLADFPAAAAAEIRAQPARPLIIAGLLAFENKMTVLHMSLQRTGTYEEPIRSKEPMVFHVGFRKVRGRPVYSENNANCDKKKFSRFFQPGTFAMASMYLPTTWCPCPVLMIKELPGTLAGCALAAQGSVLDADPDKLIIKRIILSGYPFKAHRRTCVVRYMFFNAEDIRWFSPVELHTKRGIAGKIRGPVGTHGHMKCSFSTIVQQHDIVCMSLYKRIFPKWDTEPLYPYNSWIEGVQGHRRKRVQAAAGPGTKLKF
jgi:hypothetical protein